MQTESEDSGDAPVLLEANIVSVNPPLMSEATFVVESITLTSDVETQVDFIFAEIATQIEAGDFSYNRSVQAEVTTVDRQTSLNSDELEPLEYTVDLPADGGSCLWSDFDVLGITDLPASAEYYEEAEIEAGEAAIEAGQDIPEPSMSLVVPEEVPGKSEPSEAQFVRKKAVRKTRRKHPEDKKEEEEPPTSEVKEEKEEPSSSEVKEEEKEPSSSKSKVGGSTRSTQPPALTLTRVWSDKSNPRKSQK